MKSVFYFLVSFAVFYFIFLGHFFNSKVEEVNAEPAEVAQAAEPDKEKEPEVSAIEENVVSTPEPTPEPTVAPIVEPTPKPTSTPTFEPTITPEPVPTATPDVWSPPEMEPIFARYAGTYGVDKNVLERLAVCESHFNPDAQNGDYLGMFQFSTRTWQGYRSQLGLDANPELRRDIEASIQTAAFVVQQRGTAPWPKCI